MTKLPSPRPLSIQVFAVLHLLRGLSALLNLFFLLCFLSIDASNKEFWRSHLWRVPALSLLAICHFYLWHGLWRYQPLARRFAIGLSVGLMLTPFTNLDFYLKPMVEHMWRPYYWYKYQCLQNHIAYVLLHLVEIRFLTRHKSAFVKASTPTQVSTHQ